MFQRDHYDAVIVGSGPNGISAGIVLAQQGCSVLIVEAADTPGGGVRSDALTLPGFVHDPCASIFPLTLTSPFFRTLPLDQYGLEWLHSPAVLAHPLDGEDVVLVDRSLEKTADLLGSDGKAYLEMIGYLLDDFERFSADLLGPFPVPPRSPLTYARFGLSAVRSAKALAETIFKQERARALFAGMAGHSILSLDQAASGSFGIVIAMTAHAVGWPFPRGGAVNLSRALIAYFQALGGELVSGYPVTKLDQLPQYKVALFDLAPRSFINLLGSRLPNGYRRTLSNYRYGPGVFKIDYALDGPVPWASEVATQAATLHLGGTLKEIAYSEDLVSSGKIPQKPFVIAAQTSLFDPSRAPDGKQTFWAYCHVPNGSMVDMTPAIEAQIERFAPGFSRRIIGRHVRTAVEMEAYNPNYVGGDINTGIQDLTQIFTRPAPRINPYTTPLKNIFLCSSATPPGGGVHGMSGYYAAKSALRSL